MGGMGGTARLVGDRARKDASAPAAGKVPREQMSADCRAAVPTTAMPSGDTQLGELVERARCRDVAAWRQLVERLSGFMWVIARGEGLTVGDAADVCQTAWLRLVENLDRIDEPARLRFWMGTVVRREARRVRRTIGTVVPGGDVLIGEGRPRTIQSAPVPLSSITGEMAITGEMGGIGDAMALRERSGAISRALGRLPERQRLLLRLLVAEPSLSYAEIAEVLDMPVGSIGPTRARALERLSQDPEVRALELDLPG